MANNQVDESLGVISIIEKLWEEKDYIGLRRAIGILVKEVDIRPDGAWMVLRPLRVLDGVVITTRDKAALLHTMSVYSSSFKPKPKIQRGASINQT